MRPVTIEHEARNKSSRPSREADSKIEQRTSKIQARNVANLVDRGETRITSVVSAWRGKNRYALPLVTGPPVKRKGREKKTVLNNNK